jgi:hypothetical protein
VYLISPTNGLAIVDVSTPSSPRLRHPFGSFDQSLLGTDLACVDDRAFVARSDPRVNWPMQVVDVEDPTAPTLRATYRFPNSGDTLGIDVAGNQAYVTVRDVDLGRDFLRIIDIAEATAPRVVGEFELSNTLCQWPQPIAGTNGVYVYVVCPDRLRRIDVTDPTAPHSDAELIQATGIIRDFAPLGHYGLMASDQAELTILNLSLPDRIEKISSLPLPHRASALAVSDGYAYVLGDCTDVAACSTQRILSIIDLTDQMSPRRVGNVTVNGVYQPPKLAVDGNLIYVIDAPIRILDVSDPRLPRLVNEVPWSGGFARLLSATVNGHLLVYTGLPGCGLDTCDVPCCLQVYSVSDPNQAQDVVGHLGYVTGGNALGAKLHDGLLYVADGRGGLLVLRLGLTDGTPDPDRPTASPTATLPPGSPTATPTMAITVIPITPSLTPSRTPTRTPAPTRTRIPTRTPRPTATPTPWRAVYRLYLPVAHRAESGGA